MYPHVRRLYERQEGLLVVPPLLGEDVSLGMLAAVELYRDLEAVGPHVVKVLREFSIQFQLAPSTAVHICSHLDDMKKTNTNAKMKRFQYGGT